MKEIVSVPHSEIKAHLEKEKEANAKINSLPS
jgi:hypothetical protein